MHRIDTIDLGQGDKDRRGQKDGRDRLKDVAKDEEGDIG